MTRHLDHDLEQERCPVCLRGWPRGEPSRCICGQRSPRHVTCAKCGAPIPLEALMEFQRRMNRARVDLALSLQVTPEEKAFLSNGSLVPGSMEAEE